MLPDLGPFGPAAGFLIGPLGCAKELDQVSTVDLSRSEERDETLFCRAGIGALVVKLAQGLPVRLETAASSIEFGGAGWKFAPIAACSLAAPSSWRCRPACWRRARIRIQPGLPARQRSAIERITLGARDHIAFLLPAIH